MSDNLTVQELADLIVRAKNPEDLFGPKLENIKTNFRQYVKLLNINIFPQFTEQYAKLIRLHDEAKNKLSPKVDVFTPFEIKSQKNIFNITRQISEGDISFIYGTNNNLIVKVAKDPAYNDYLINERDVLWKINPADAPVEKYLRYLPKLLHSFIVKNGSLKQVVNVFQEPKDYIVFSSLDNHLLAADGPLYDFKDAAWIFKRLLEGIGFVHKSKIIHGSIIPEHILIDPENHGAKIIDWCWAKTDAPLKSITKHRKSFYPPEVFEKKNLCVESDIYMIVKCIIHLLGGNTETNEFHPKHKVPWQIKNFLESCLIANPARRPNDSWELHEQFSELLKSLVGPPKFKEFKIP